MADSTLKGTIQTSMVTAMRAQDKIRLGVIRLIQAAIKQQEVDERIVLNDEQVLNLLDKMIRQRRDSIRQFEAGKRDDLVQKENAEIKIIQEFLPEPLSQQEIQKLVQAAIVETSAASMRDMSKVMAILKPNLQGRADMDVVGILVKNQLNSMS
jgi:uncharacterized protein YqeY